MKRDASAAAPPRPTVVAVVAATTGAQVASVLGAAIFPVIAPKLALDLAVPASLVGYQVSITYGTAMVATAYGWIGSYTLTFGWLTIVAVLGLVFISLARNSAAVAFAHGD